MRIVNRIDILKIKLAKETYFKEIKKDSSK